MTLLSYDIEHPTLRPPVEEWQPHATQTAKSTEWWYLTSLAFDTAGNPYFLVWCLFHFGGEDTHNASIQVPEGHRLNLGMLGVTDYNADHHFDGVSFAVMKDGDTWNTDSNAVHYALSDYSGAWSFTDDGMNVTVDSPKVMFDLRLTGTDQVMYAKDKLGVEGFIQEGAPEDRSYYYSLPRLNLAGRIAFPDKNGVRREVELQGTAWVDRQWGDFLTKSWEWSSFRFNNGARVNLYNFANGYQIGTYQRADGSTEWFDSFVVRQDGYMKVPSNGVWMSWGWSYEFPIDIEGSRTYTLKPFSQKDVYVTPDNTLFEGPSHLVDSTTGEVVGIAVTESMDVRIMNNAPGGPNQR
ncbi:lipocalin-like domain-containing protein [Streptomyces sp. NPDC093544]|uniref:lipocalin-like domain-containing protein n=1 Tax=Streptomyces sp. NPDC093544 TaxID=3155200 RepID=UPI00344313BB